MTGAPMRRWLPAALLACFWWGLFGFLAKLGAAGAGALDMQVLFTLGTLPLMLYILLLRRAELRADRTGRITGVVIGLFAGLGGIAYFHAMASGKASLVGPVTSLFPLITVILATAVLKERLNRVQAAGVVLALVSAAMLAV